jgi:nitroreductase
MLDEHIAAEVAAPLHDLLRRRRSPRAFAERPVEPEKLQSILEAARWAPSSANRQPWSFVVATKEQPAAYDALYHLLMEGNRRWAGAAPVLILSVAQGATDPTALGYAFHDVGLATAHLLTQATALGLATHAMGGFDRAAAREVLALPEGHEPVAVIAVGYPGDPQALPDDLRARELAPRVRKPLHEFTFQGRWGSTAWPAKAEA